MNRKKKIKIKKEGKSMQKKAQNKNWIVTGDKKKFKERN